MKFNIDINTQNGNPNALGELLRESSKKPHGRRLRPLGRRGAHVSFSKVSVSI